MSVITPKVSTFAPLPQTRNEGNGDGVSSVTEHRMYPNHPTAGQVKSDIKSQTTNGVTAGEVELKRVGDRTRVTVTFEGPAGYARDAANDFKAGAGS